MAGLARLIAPLTVTAAAGSHFGYIGEGSLSITQPDVLTASFNAIDGSVEYSGKYHLVKGNDSFHLTSSGVGVSQRWCVSQHFQVPHGAPSRVEVDYNMRGVFGRSDGDSSEGTQFSRILPPGAPPARLPRVEIVRSLGEMDIEITFKKRRTWYGDERHVRMEDTMPDIYVMNSEGLRIDRDENHQKKKKIPLSELNSVHLKDGKLIVTITPEQHINIHRIKIRPDFGEIVVRKRSRNISYFRSSWTTSGK